MDEAYVRETFQDISIYGRTAYAILCFEEYVLKFYPAKDFSPVSELMWGILDDARGSVDDKAFFYNSIVPECLFEFDTYEASRADNDAGEACPSPYLSREAYDMFRKLLDPEDSKLNTLMDDIFHIITQYLYSGVRYPAAEIFPYLGECMDILNELQLPLPDIAQVKEYRCGEGPRRDAWGESIPFPGKSKILRCRE